MCRAGSASSEGAPAATADAAAQSLNLAELLDVLVGGRCGRLLAYAQKLWREPMAHELAGDRIDSLGARAGA